MGFVCHKQVQFHETDAMGVVHHANYLRYWEEARAAWLRAADLMRIHAPYTDLSFAVLESSCQHHSPCRFGDEISIRLQVRAEGAKIRFQYAAFSTAGNNEKKEEEKLIATGHTLHIALDGNFRVCRLPALMRQKLESEEWTETWP